MTEAVVVLLARVLELPGRALALVARAAHCPRLWRLVVLLLVPSALLLALAVHLSGQRVSGRAPWHG